MRPECRCTGCRGGAVLKAAALSWGVVTFGVLAFAQVVFWVWGSP